MAESTYRFLLTSVHQVWPHHCRLDIEIAFNVDKYVSTCVWCDLGGMIVSRSLVAQGLTHSANLFICWPGCLCLLGNFYALCFWNKSKVAFYHVWLLMSNDHVPFVLWSCVASRKSLILLFACFLTHGVFSCETDMRRCWPPQIEWNLC